MRQSLPADATVAGRLPPRARLRVTLILKPRHPAALAAYARAVSTPGSPSFRRYLRPAEFGRRFGASPGQIAVVRRTLVGLGLHPGPASAGHLSIPLRATAAGLERGLSISLLMVSRPGRRTAVSADVAPSLKTRAARLVQSILGLDAGSSPRPLLVRPAPGFRRTLGSAPSPPTVTSGPQPCAQASSQAGGAGAYTADQIASAYGFSGLYAGGDDGSGVTVAVYELESDNPADIAAYESCYGIHASVSYVPVDGGAGSGSGSGEAALDIENLIGLAPGANVLVYQGPNSTSGAPGSGPYDTFSAIVNQDRAQVVSVSWGQCEAGLGAASAIAENTLFEQAAVQGQTIVAAAGDGGSEDCNAGGTAPQTQLAVDDPSSQPWVIGVGGTTLTSLGPRPTESVWNSGGTISAGLPQPGAGGGGISTFWAMPPSQLDAAPALNVLGAGSTGALCGQPSGYCRQVPDVAANADPTTGYEIYWNGSHSQLGQPSGWQTVAGTSAAAPVWAALMTLGDASRACHGSRLGFAGAALYHAAGHSYANDFNDVRTGNDDFTATNEGKFAAGPGYDEASGLGTPNAAALAPALCAGTLRVMSPGRQRSTAHAHVSLRLTSGDSPGTAVHLNAAGLPPGLSLNPVTGVIAGRPQRTGRFDVTVAAQDPFGANTSIAFSWSVGAAPRVSHRWVSGLASQRPHLGFTLTAGRDAPAFAQLRLRLPSDLRLVSTRQVGLGSGRTPRTHFRARLVHGTLQITLRRPLKELRLVLTYPDLRVDVRRRAQPGHRGDASKLDLRIVDTGAGTTEIGARLAPGR